MKRNLFFSVLIMLTQSPLIAQNLETFTVTGTAVQRVQADELVISAGISIESDGNVQDLFRSTQKVTSEALEYLRSKQGVKKVETDVVRLQSVYHKDRDGFFRSTQTLNIILSDFSIYDEVMTFLIGKGFNQIGYVGFRLSDLSGRKLDVQLDAVSAARSKADKLALAMGVKLGDVVHFSEESLPVYRPMENALRFSSSDASGGESSIAPTEVEITQKVTITYAIKRD